MSSADAGANVVEDIDSSSPGRFRFVLAEVSVARVGLLLVTALKDEVVLIVGPDVGSFVANAKGVLTNRSPSVGGGVD